MINVDWVSSCFLILNHKSTSIVVRIFFLSLGHRAVLLLFIFLSACCDSFFALGANRRRHLSCDCLFILLLLTFTFFNHFLAAA